jgi:beta-propeller repeat-containing protein
MHRIFTRFSASLSTLLLITLAFPVAFASIFNSQLPRRQSGRKTSFGTPSAKNDSLFVRRDNARRRTNEPEIERSAPLRFESNHGQANSVVKFLTRDNGNVLFLTSNELVMNSRDAGCERVGNNDIFEQPQSKALRMRFVASNSTSRIRGEGEQGKSNYFLGRNASRWETGISSYTKVRYEQIYPGIDLLFYGTQAQLEYDFVVAPGADFHAIRLGFDGADTVGVDQHGDLVINTLKAELRHHKPFAYQEIHGAKTRVEASFVVAASGTVSFEVASYDPREPLIIDPVLVYSSLLGGTNSDDASSIAVDKFGNIYVAGGTFSEDFPSTGAPSPGLSKTTYVTKFDPTGKHVIYSTFIGGHDFEEVRGLALDAMGNAYLTGWTTSVDFPTTPGAYQSTYKGGGLFGEVIFGGDGFIVKLDPTGSLVYSTLLGGSLADNFQSIAVDAQGNAYVAGYSWSIDFPSTPGAYQTANHASPFYAPYATNENEDAFVAKLNRNGTALLFSTFIGGRFGEFVGDMKLDQSNNIVLVGSTHSDDYPTTPGAFSGVLPFNTTYVTKLNSTGTSLIASTGIGHGSGMGVALDAMGNVYITGGANPDYPTTPGVFQPLPSPLNSGTQDAYITKLNPELSRLICSTFLGGGGHDLGEKIAVDAMGDAYVTGGATFGFPTTPDAFEPLFGGGPASSPFAGGSSDAFLTKLNPTATALIYSSYLGGGNDPNDSDDVGTAVALDVHGNAYVAGTTFASTFPTTPGAFKQTHALFDIDAFFARFAFAQFDLCIQDDSNRGFLQINTTSGDYQFNNCSGFTVGGIGTLTKRGNTITLSHSESDRRVSATIDTGLKRANASIQFLSPARTFTIVDRNIANNTCTCQ